MNDIVPVADAAKKPGVEMFSFGEPIPTLDGRDILDYVEAWFNGRWYEPPVDLYGLARSFRCNPHHSSAIYVKRNVLVSSFIPHPLLSRQDFSHLVLDFLVMGNGYLENLTSVTGKTIKLRPSLAKYTRVGPNDTFFFLQSQSFGAFFQFENEVIHLLEPDVNQEVYGIPEYLSALQSAWLNESATLFRRKYYLNGTHAGFILYMTDAAAEQGDIDAMRTALKNSKGPGNFRNVFMYAPNGHKDGLQVIPIAEVAAKDEFFNIKNVTRDDVLVGHRVPPQLMGIIPHNTGGFGDAAQAAMVFARNELAPLQARFLEINERLGQEVIRFNPYDAFPSATAGG